MKKENLIIKANKVYKKYRDKEELWRYGELVITMLAIAFFIVFAIRPTVKAISGLLSEIENKEELSSKMGKKINQVIAAQTNYAAVQQQIDYLDQAYPQQPQIADGAAQLVGLGIEKGLVLDSVSFSEVDVFVKDSASIQGQPEKSQGVGFSVSFFADYQKTKSFLADLKNLRRVLIIDGYSISIPDDVDQDWVNLSLSGLLPYYQQ